MSLPSGPLDGLLSAFSSSSNNFALATPDGRVRTYDTGGLLLVPALNSAGTPAAVTFTGQHAVAKHACRRVCAWFGGMVGAPGQL